MFLKKLFHFIPKNEFSQALHLYNNGNYRKALKKFTELRAGSGQASDIDKSTLDLYTCEAHVALSKEYASMGNLDDAIIEMRAATEIKPTFADLHYMLGTFYAQRGEFSDAENSFRYSLAINNKFFRAHIHLSLALRALHHVEEAAAELATARMSCPNFYRENLDELCAAIRNESSDEEVESLYRGLLEERPSSAQLSRELAIHAIQNGDDEEAIRELRKAIALKPDYPDLHNYLGIAYGNSGMIVEAVEEFGIALKINPYYSKARLNLALLHYENNNFNEAKVELEQVLKVMPDNQLANNLMEELTALADGQ